MKEQSASVRLSVNTSSPVNGNHDDLVNFGVGDKETIHAIYTIYELIITCSPFLNNGREL